MILILVYWFILFLFASLSGIAFQNTFGLLKTNISFTLLFGIIFQTLFLSFCAFFGRIHYEVFLLNILIQLFFYVKFRSDFKLFFRQILSKFSNKQLYFFGSIVILTALKSAQFPSIFDNESYYLQTIKWLNEYGFVKGVANVHPFLGQFSFWHVLQSGFSFPFFPIHFNDINGFLLLITIFYFIENYIKNGLTWSFFGIVFLIFYFQFLDAPSPDLPILIFCAIIFNEYIEKTTHPKIILLFLTFIVFLKLTIAPLLLLAIFIIFENKKHTFFLGMISVVFGSFWIAKNIVITGYPLFPLSFLETNVDWKMSEKVLQKLAQITVDAGYTENLITTSQLSLWEKLRFWIHLSGVNSIFNKGILILFFIVPFLPFFKTNKKFRILYGILLLHFIFLLVTSPQYRFYLPTFILFSIIIIYEISKKLPFSIKNFTILSSFLLLLTALFFDGKKNTEDLTFRMSQLFIPEKNTKYVNQNFEYKIIEKFEFNDPKLPNLYETSDGNLPCVNEKLFHYYNYFPQQRTNQIKDGFYAKEITNE